MKLFTNLTLHKEDQNKKSRLFSYMPLFGCGYMMSEILFASCSQLNKLLANSEAT